MDVLPFFRRVIGALHVNCVCVCVHVVGRSLTQ